MAPATVSVVAVTCSISILGIEAEAEPKSVAFALGFLL